MGLPIAITVEGSNIVTRSLIIFGQGLIRCHPFAVKEMEALEQDMLPFGIIDSGYEDSSFTDGTGQLWQIADDEHQRSYF